MAVLAYNERLECTKGCDPGDGFVGSGARIYECWMTDDQGNWLGTVDSQLDKEPDRDAFECATCGAPARIVVLENRN